MSRPMKMGAAAAVISASVLLSRLLGLGREALLENDLAVSESAEVEAPGPGVDAQDARHQSAAARS